MKITVIGAGAMGSVYGGHLSGKHQVYRARHESGYCTTQINREGLKIDEDGATNTYRHPTAVTGTEGLGEMDLVILFVKSIYSRAALAGNQGVIGEKTRLLTLQNGAGHEDILKEFVPEDRVIIGTTEDNGAVLAPGHVRRGGVGSTNVGMPDGGPRRIPAAAERGV